MEGVPQHLEPRVNEGWSFAPAEMEALEQLRSYDEKIVPVVQDRPYLRWLFDPVLVIADLTAGIPAGWVPEFGDSTVVGKFPPAVVPLAQFPLAAAAAPAQQLPGPTLHLGCNASMVFEFANRSDASQFIGYVMRSYPAVRLMVVDVTTAAMANMERF